MQPSTLHVTPEQAEDLPDHTQLPDRDGSIVNNTQESPQSNLLTESLLPRLRELHPDEQFCVGCDVGIYFRATQPVLAGCRAPDWFFVPGVPPMLDGKIRRSYVLWKEVVKPTLLVEYVSGDGSEEHDRTPNVGKFWVYEQAICGAYYAIFDGQVPSVEVYRLEAGRYRPVPANPAGRYPVEPLRIELGLWEGKYRGIVGPWLRAWDVDTGQMLTLAEERIEVMEASLDETRSLLDEQVEQTEQQRRRADQFAARLRELGIDPEG